MSGAKHAPGPWAGDGSGQVFAVRSGRTVAKIESSADSEREAIESLIAAAPDIKSALALAVRALEAMREPTRLHRQAILEGRAALARSRP